MANHYFIQMFRRIPVWTTYLFSKEISSHHSPSFYSWRKVFSVVTFISWPFILQLYEVYLASSKVYIALVLLDGFCYIRGCNLMLESLSIKYKETFQTIGHMCRICNNNKWPHLQNIYISIYKTAAYAKIGR